MTSSAAPALSQDALRARLGLDPLGQVRARSVLDWAIPLGVTLLALVLRLVHLGRPHALVFDETYYVKQAASMLALGYEGEWPDDYDARFAAGDLSGLMPQADYVVHPPVGKWLMAAGQFVVGSDSAVGWRISGAVVGALGVLLVTLVVTRVLRSRLLGGVAGFFLAVDGVHLVLSRTGLLDVFLSTFVLAGFALVLLDQRWARARLARRLARDPDPAVGSDVATSGAPDGGSVAARRRSPLGPAIGVRWWLVAAGIVLGLSAGIKWSGVYSVAVFGILAFALDAQARRAAGVRAWFGGAVLRGGIPQFLSLVPAAALAYLAGWASWFTNPNAYLRGWAAEQRAAGADVPGGWMGDALASLWHYHREMYTFHTGLSSEHSYMSSPFGWIIQWRPTSFYWPDPLPEGAQCGAARCVQAITSLGNPLIWWLGALALLVVLLAAIVRRDVRAWAILAGYAATWLPWFQYLDRTIFTFYTVALVPYVVMALTFALGWALGLVRLPSAGAPSTDLAALTPTVPPLTWRSRRTWVLAGVLLLVAALSAFYWPIWTGATVSYDFWRLHMWLPSWV